MNDAQVVATIVGNWLARFVGQPFDEKATELHTATAWKILAEAKKQAPDNPSRGIPLK